MPSQKQPAKPKLAAESPAELETVREALKLTIELLRQIADDQRERLRDIREMRSIIAGMKGEVRPAADARGE